MLPGSLLPLFLRREPGDEARITTVQQEVTAVGLPTCRGTCGEGSYGMGMGGSQREIKRWTVRGGCLGVGWGPAPLRQYGWRFLVHLWKCEIWVESSTLVGSYLEISPAGGSIHGGGIRVCHTDNQPDTEVTAHPHFRQHCDTKHGCRWLNVRAC